MSERQLRVVELRNLPVGELTAPQRDFLAAESMKVKCKLGCSALISPALITALMWLIIDALGGCVLSGCGGHGDCVTLSAWHVTHCVCDDDYTYAGAHCTTPGYSEEEFANFAAANFSRWYQFNDSWRHTANNEAWHSWWWTITDNPSTYVAVKRHDGSTPTCNGLPVYQQAGGLGHVLWYSNESYAAQYFGTGAWFLGNADGFLLSSSSLSSQDCIDGGVYAWRRMAAIPPDDANTNTSWAEYLAKACPGGQCTTPFGIVSSGP